MPISVGIPTCNRLDMLLECIESIFANDYRPIEVVVSDDAHDPQVSSALTRIDKPSGISVKYVPNTHGRGQAANVKNAIHHASSEMFILMHDDDYFVPHGIDRLAEAWNAHDGRVAAVYGWLYHVDKDRHVCQERTDLLREIRHRNMPSGAQPSPLWAALSLQVPQNGFMIRRSVANAMPIFDETQVGTIPIDYHFNINYALHCSGDFLLIHDYVSAYRQSSASVIRPTGLFKSDHHLHYLALTRVPVTTALERKARDLALLNASRRAIIGFAAVGDARQARQVLMRHFRHLRRWQDRVRLPLLVAMATLHLRIPAFLGAERYRR